MGGIFDANQKKIRINHSNCKIKRNNVADGRVAQLRTGRMRRRTVKTIGNRRAVGRLAVATASRPGLETLGLA